MSDRLLDYVTSGPWALEGRVYGRLLQVLVRHARGDRVPGEDVAAITAARDSRMERQLPSGYVNRDGVGIVPISGVIARHARQVNGSSQPRGTSIEQLRADFRAALGDDEAHTIMLAIDSPGGSVEGLVDMADEMRAARGRKPMVAHVSGVMASAAYWLGAQADEVYATRGSEVGSIGVIAAVVDDHRAFEQEGVDVRYVTSAPEKALGREGKSQGLEDLKSVEADVQAFHELFVDAVASGRGISREDAVALADGRVHMAARAFELGLIDGVTGEHELIDHLRERSSKEARLAASIQTGNGHMTNAKADAGGGALPVPTITSNAQPTVVISSVPPATVAQLRGAFPDLCAEIATAAVSAERDRTQQIAAAAEGQAPGVVASALASIKSGASLSESLSAMLKVAGAQQAVVKPNPIDAIRAGMAGEQTVGAAPAITHSTASLKAQWEDMSSEQKREFHDRFYLFEEAVRN